MSSQFAEQPWVYDPDTKHVYRGFPFDGLEKLDTDEDGQPILSPAAKAAVTRAQNKAEEAAK